MLSVNNYHQSYYNNYIKNQSINFKQKFPNIDGIKMKNFNTEIQDISEFYTNEKLIDKFKAYASAHCTKTIFNNLHDKICPQLNIEQSSTMKKLFTDKYKPPKRLNEKNWAVTTIIDSRTDQPVEMLIKNERKNKGVEYYNFFIEKGIANYYCIGARVLKIDRENKIISPGYMANYDNAYSGIGIRAHQIAIERMMQENLDNVVINSTESAFPFHYKCGFRLPSITLDYTEEDLFKHLDTWHEYTGISWEDIIKNLKFKEKNSLYEVNYKTEENLFVEKVKNGCNKIMQSLYMWLEPKELEMWKNKAKSQPIYL